MSKNLSIVVGSCDAYSDIAALYVRFLRRYWKDCDCQIFVATENAVIDEPGVITVTSEGTEWAKRIINTVEKTNTDYIWLTVDDLFISKEVDDRRVTEILNIIQREGIQYYGLPTKPLNPQKRKPYKNYETVFSISKNAAYGVNMVTAIWEKKELLRILNDGIETAWDVEDYFLEKASKQPGGYYEHYVDDFGYSVIYSHMIKKGKWIRKGVREIENSGIQIDYKKRGYEPLKSRARTLVVGTGKKICPVWARAEVKKLLTKVGFKFATKY